MRSGTGAARMVVIAVFATAAWWAAVAMPVATAGTDGSQASPRQRTAISSAARHTAPLVRDGVGAAARGGKRGLAAPAMSARMLRANEERQVSARRFLRMLRRNASAAAKCADRACRTGLPAARDLKRTQQAQIRDYYCGPATVSEMLA
jgi:hypothetical protein